MVNIRNKLVGLPLLACAFTVACAFVPPSTFGSGGRLSFQVMSSSAENAFDGEQQRRLEEFVNLDPLPESAARRMRIEQEEENERRFAKFGDDLWNLRTEMQDLSVELLEAINNGKRDDEKGIRRTLRKLEKKDPELLYKLELENAKRAERDGDGDAAFHHMENAMNARKCLPQFNLEGLWVGKYGSHGYEMINVTYAGDLMIAYKVTGDKNVPRGEITFQADLSPTKPKQVGRGESRQETLSPIVLTDRAAKKWGTKQLPRYHGVGHVAEEDYNNSQWMEGQLIIIGQEYFSFAWIPLEHQIFFGRPSPELALKMLRDGGSSSLKGGTWEAPPTIDDDIHIWKDYATHLLERTEEKIDEELEGNEFGCIWHGAEEECYFQ